MASVISILPGTGRGTVAEGDGGGALPLGDTLAALPLLHASHGPLPRTGEDWAAKRGALETYFDRTAVKAWEALTSDAPVSRIRATVRAGREAMRATMLSWLPDDLTGMRVLDAGCGTGAFAVALAERGAEVVAIDVAARLVEVARDRAPAGLAIDWRTGDFADPALGRFDHVVAMDSLIHYAPADAVATLARIAPRVDKSIVFTFAPRTPALAAMHVAGKLFPRSDRSPAIEPVAEAKLRNMIARDVPMTPGRTHRVATGFYVSQALELIS